MARIKGFVRGDRDVRAPRTAVDAYVQSFSEDGTEYLYVYNYAAGGPKPGDTPTQSLHFDRSAAVEFRKILDDTFGPFD